MTPCEAGFHPVLRHYPPEDDGMGAWKCDECGHIQRWTDLVNHGVEEACKRMLAKAEEKEPSGRFGYEPMNEIVDKMRSDDVIAEADTVDIKV